MSETVGTATRTAVPGSTPGGTATESVAPFGVCMMNVSPGFTPIGMTTCITSVALCCSAIALPFAPRTRGSDLCCAWLSAQPKAHLVTLAWEKFSSRRPPFEMNIVCGDRDQSGIAKTVMWRRMRFAYRISQRRKFSEESSAVRWSPSAHVVTWSVPQCRPSYLTSPAPREDVNSPRI